MNVLRWVPWRKLLKWVGKKAAEEAVRELQKRVEKKPRAVVSTPLPCLLTDEMNERVCRCGTKHADWAGCAIEAPFDRDRWCANCQVRPT